MLANTLFSPALEPTPSLLSSQVLCLSSNFREANKISLCPPLGKEWGAMHTLKALFKKKKNSDPLPQECFLMALCVRHHHHKSLPLYPRRDQLRGKYLPPVFRQAACLCAISLLQSFKIVMGRGKKKKNKPQTKAPRLSHANFNTQYASW